MAAETASHLLDRLAGQFTSPDLPLRSPGQERSARVHELPRLNLQIGRTGGDRGVLVKEQLPALVTLIQSESRLPSSTASYSTWLTWLT